MTSKQTDLCFLSIEESSRLIHSGQLSPVELTQAYLDRIEAVDEKVGGYITVLAEAALAEATGGGEGHHGRPVQGTAPRHPHGPQGPV